MSRAAARLVIVLSLVLLVSRGFPAVTTTESCQAAMNTLLDPGMVLACAPGFNADITTDYSIFNLSTSYDPWPGVTLSAVAPNGRSVLFYPAALFSGVWAVLALRRARELPTFQRRRAKRRSMRIGAGLLCAVLGTALTVNLLQVPRFEQQWTSQTCGTSGWCSATPQWGLYVLIAAAVGLIAGLALSAWTLESDTPSAAEMAALRSLPGHDPPPHPRPIVT